MAKQETIKVKEKDIVILRFDGTFPITEPDLHAMMKTIRDAVNKDQTIVNRFICLANGINVEAMSEEDFKAIWKAKWGEASFQKAEEELEELEKNPPTTIEEAVQDGVPGYNPAISSSDFAGLEQQPPPKHEDEIQNIDDVLGSLGPNAPNNTHVDLNNPDEIGNVWKPLSDEDLEKELKKIQEEEGDK